MTSASPAASNTSTGLLSRLMIRCQENVTSPATIDTAIYRQSLIAAGVCAPMMTSRVIPPELPAAKDKTRTPNKSSLCLIPAVAPLSANTKVPPRSKATSSLLTTICSLTINDPTQPNVLIRLHLRIDSVLPLASPTMLPLAWSVCVRKTGKTGGASLSRRRRKAAKSQKGGAPGYSSESASSRFDSAIELFER